jgi:hypothetical protein
MASTSAIAYVIFPDLKSEIAFSTVGIIFSISAMHSGRPPTLNYPE